MAPVAPLILSELPENANSSDELRRTARRLVGSVDAVLFGDANWMRVRFPPSYRARVLHDVGLGAWPGINARDRNRVALEGELAALADLGVAGVHCVTGNHTYSGHRPDAAPVFDLDSTRLTELAATYGHRISVAASPHTPPVHLRATRTAGKAAAGAVICMVDQPSTSADLAAFIADTRASGALDLGFVPVVSVVFERDDFARWSQYPNARIPFGWAERIAGAHDVSSTGMSLALELAESLLAVDGTVGVLFASTASPDRCDQVADTFAALAVDLRRRALSAQRFGAATPPGG
jgi:5,10-methylenetetrahydrofolate reductase